MPTTYAREVAWQRHIPLLRHTDVTTFRELVSDQATFLRVGRSSEFCEVKTTLVPPVELIGGVGGEVVKPFGL